MALTRRQFLTLMGGTAAGAVIFQACGVPEKEILVQSPLEMPEDLVSGMDNWYATLCQQCPTSEGVVVRVMEGRAKKIEGNVDYPINEGRHSARCEAGLQALYSPDRIKGPLVRVGERGSGQFEEISWTDAIGRLSHQLQQLQAAGQESQMVFATQPVGAHLGLVIDRFVSSFGGRHLPFEPLEHTTLRQAMKQVFNQDVMPDFDIEHASFVLSFGADFLNTWCSPVRYARGYGEFRQGNRERGTLVHIDSRFSMTAANADEWFYVSPGMEGLLALSIAQVIVSEGLADAAVVNDLTNGQPEQLDAFAPNQIAEQISDAYPPHQVAQKIREIALEFAAPGSKPALAIGGGSAGAHTNGLANLVAIYSLNYLVGSVGKEGGIVFNPEPSLASIPKAPSGSSFQDWQNLVGDMKRGNVKLMMVHRADPWYGLPDSTGFKDALYDVPFVFSFSSIMDDTTSMADLILPEHNYLEDWGVNIPDPGPGYEMIGIQQPVTRPFFESRGIHLGTRSCPDVLLTTAQGLGLDIGLEGDTFKDILQNAAVELFDRNRGSVRSLDFKSFWNGMLQRGGWWDISAKYEGPQPKPQPFLEIESPDFDSRNDRSYPFHLIPFASTSLTDGRGSHLPWLQATPDPISTATWRTWVEINHRVAEEMGIVEGDVLRVVSSHGSIEALAYPHPGMAPGIVSVPMGQGHTAGGRYAQQRGANVLSLLSPLTDPASGALAWSATRIRIEKTGQWERLPKFENTVPDIPVDEGQHVIEITPIDS